MGKDAAAITRRGTPGYATPSWYRDGHPDMYGAAATLYALLTGNAPDKMGRAAFLWPPQGENSLSKTERAEWKRLHGIIRRATEEKVSERYLDFKAMAAAIRSGQSPDSPGRKRPRPVVWALALGLAVCAGGWWFVGRIKPDPLPDQAGQSASKPPAVSESNVTNPAIPSPASKVVSKRHVDGNLAYNALSWIQIDPDDPDSMSFDENSLFQDTLGKIQNCIWDENNLDFPTAGPKRHAPGQEKSQCPIGASLAAAMRGRPFYQPRSGDR